ncbi:34194_t:CDS:2, partial [Racocetra persica]
TEVSTVETPAIDSNSDFVLSEECQKQLNHKYQKHFRDNNKETNSHLFIDVSKELQYLLNTEVSIVVVETPAIDIESDSDNLLPLLTTEVPMITDLKLSNTLNSCCDKTKRYDIASDIAAIMVGNGHK